MTEAADLFTTRFEGPAPEVDVSTDMIKRGLIVAPMHHRHLRRDLGRRRRLVVAYGIAIVLANFALAAAIIAMTARISLGADAWAPRCSAT